MFNVQTKSGSVVIAKMAGTKPAANMTSATSTMIKRITSRGPCSSG